MAGPQNSPPPSRGPVTAWWYKLAYAMDRMFKTGSRRAEFEHKYRAHGDYFGYQTKPYELKKYQDTFSVVRRFRRNTGSVLELACSVGVFTKLLASEFNEVVASDISEEALRIAAQTVGGTGKVSFVRSDVEGIDVRRQFDVVMISEVLLFVKESDGPRILDMLDRHLKPNGIVVEVANANRPTNSKFFFDWDKIISSRFPILYRERHDDPTWPYEIVVYAREPARDGAGPAVRNI